MKLLSTVLIPLALVGVLAWNAVADHQPRGGGAAAGASSAPNRCHALGTGLLVLPDPRCTPGRTNPEVTPATIGRTICKPGWTRTVRPPESVTEPIKRRMIRLYGYYASHRLSSYELDHLIPLELGGAPNDTRNLWPEVDYAGVPSQTYYRNPKDRLERVLNRRVCAGRMSLARARAMIATDWVAAYRRYVR